MEWLESFRKLKSGQRNFKSWHNGGKVSTSGNLYKDLNVCNEEVIWLICVSQLN